MRHLYSVYSSLQEGRLSLSLLCLWHSVDPRLHRSPQAPSKLRGLELLLKNTAQTSQLREKVHLSHCSCCPAREPLCCYPTHHIAVAQTTSKQTRKVISSSREVWARHVLMVLNKSVWGGVLLATFTSDFQSKKKAPPHLTPPCPASAQDRAAKHHTAATQPIDVHAEHFVSRSLQHQLQSEEKQPASRAFPWRFIRSIQGEHRSPTTNPNACRPPLEAQPVSQHGPSPQGPSSGARWVRGLPEPHRGTCCAGSRAGQRRGPPRGAAIPLPIGGSSSPCAVTGCPGCGPGAGEGGKRGGRGRV